MLVHFSPTGAELSRRYWNANPKRIWVSPTDASLWVHTFTGLAHLSPDGQSVLWSEGDLSGSNDFRWDPTALSFDPTDGSCWVTPTLGGPDWVPWEITPAHLALRHFAPDGGVLWQSEDSFGVVETLGVNPADGSVWVTGLGEDPLVRISPTGEVLARHAPDSHLYSPPSATSDPTDGSVLVRDTGYLSYEPVHPNYWGYFYRNSALVRYAADGSESWRGETLETLSGDPAVSWGHDKEPALSVNGADGTFWVVYPNLGNRTLGINYPQLVIRHAHDGTELARYTVTSPGEHLDVAEVVAAAPDGSCWIAICYFTPAEDMRYLVHIASDGTELQRWYELTPGHLLNYVHGLVVNPTDGSVWLSCGFRQAPYSEVAKLTADGQLLWTIPFCAGSLDVDPVTGFAWTSGGYTVPMAILSNTGQVLWEDIVCGYHGKPSVNSTDGTCWIGDKRNREVVHFSVPLTRFNDIPYDFWAKDQIKALSEAGLVGGYADGCYRPANVMTRDQMAVYLARALAGGDEAVPAVTTPATFPDVPADHWAFKYVEYCYAHGIAGGYEDGYRPTKIVDRGQMAVFVARAMAGGDSGVPAGPATAYFTDVPTNYWAFRYVEYIRVEGVAGGYGNGQYRPDMAVTRDQMAVYVTRAFGL